MCFSGYYGDPFTEEILQHVDEVPAFAGGPGDIAGNTGDNSLPSSHAPWKGMPMVEGKLAKK